MRKLFYLKTFGSVSLTGDAGVIGGRAVQRHRLALLALLASAGTAGMTRDKLVAYLWPEADDERGRHLLSNSLYILRQSLGENAITGTGDVVRLDSDHVQSDVREFEEALSRRELARGISLYTGSFFDGFFLTDAPEFERWLTRERERLADSYARALESLATAAENEGDVRVAADWWKARAGHDPLDSRIALRLMQALEAAGNRAGALQHASIHQRLLEEELNIGLPKDIAAFSEQLRRKAVSVASQTPRAAPPFSAEGRTIQLPGVTTASPAETIAPIDVAVESPELNVTGASNQSSGVSAPRIYPQRRFAVLLALACIVAAVFSAWKLWPGGGRDQSIVVLPFVNLSANAENEYFSDGITEEVIAQLAAMPSLKVISRTSAMYYKGTRQPLRAIAGELGVAHVLEGSVRRDGNQVRITAQLIDAATDEHLWAQQYDRKLDDVFAVQADIAREVARALEVTLKGNGRTTVARGTRVPEAYEAYLHGRYHWQKRTHDGHHQAIAYFNRAIERDSGYADAYAGLAGVYLTGYAQYVPGFADREAETYAALKASAERSVELDENSSLAHRAMALLRWWERDWANAERELLRTLELNPGDEQAHNWYGALLGLTGRIEDAEREARIAYEMDPFNLAGSTNYADQLVLARKYDDAIVIARRSLEINPSHPFARRSLGMMYTFKGLHGEAERELRRVADSMPHIPDFQADLAFSMARAGRHDAALSILQKVVTLPDGPRKRDASYSIGRAYVALGLIDSAFVWFDRADWRWPHRGNRYDPLLDPVRADPRFVQLSRRIDEEMRLR